MMLVTCLVGGGCLLVGLVPVGGALGRFRVAGVEDGRTRDGLD